VLKDDSSCPQPTWTPPNCKFELDDAAKEWTFPDNTFDFIHIRLLLGSIEDYVKLYKQAYRCLKPGGWLEHTDFTIDIKSDDGSVPADSPYSTWNKIYKECGEKTGRTFLVTEGNRQSKLMIEAGFPANAVHGRHYKLPLGTWVKGARWKEIGLFNLESCSQGLEGYVLYLGTEILGWKYEELQVLLAGMRKALANPKYHAYYPG